ncbi:MAG: single-stranded DNA-binding protein [Acholeplasmataceae bacterium]
MFNQIALVGRLVHDPEIKTLDSGKRVSEITLAVRRAFKNMDGNYDTDFLRVTLWEGLAETVTSYMQKGTMVLIVGRTQIRRYDISEDRYLNIIEIIAERVTYLSNPYRKDDESRLDDESSF